MYASDILMLRGDVRLTHGQQLLIAEELHDKRVGGQGG
jgi:hypothetical protein